MELWVSVSSMPLFDDAGELRGAVHFVKDSRDKPPSTVRQRHASGATTTVVTFLDPHLRIRHAHHVGAELFGIRAEETIGRICYDVRHDRSSPCPGCPSIEALETGVPVERVDEDPDGWSRWIQSHPVLDETGRCLGVVESAVITANATEVARAARKRNELVRAVLMASTGMVVVVQTVRDELGSVVDFEGVLANPAAEALMGPVVGTRLSTSHERTDNALLEALLRRVVETGQHERLEMQSRGHGDTRLFAVSAVRVGDGTALTLTDITKQKRAEDTAQERADLARQAAVVDATVAANRGLAHDLNNLLQSASSHACFALDALAASDPVRTDLQHALTATRAAAALVRRLAIPPHSQWACLSINGLIEGYSDVLACLVSSHGELHFDLCGGLASVRGDEEQLQQVLLNLCLNARDALLPGGTATVSTRAVDSPQVNGIQDGPWVEIAVTDTGVGIADEALGRIFEPLFTTKPADRGSGLGLPTVLAIIERHGGHIDVESVLGRGTTMRVLLPCA